MSTQLEEGQGVKKSAIIIPGMVDIRAAIWRDSYDIIVKVLNSENKGSISTKHPTLTRYRKRMRRSQEYLVSHRVRSPETGSSSPPCLQQEQPSKRKHIGHAWELFLEV